MKYQAGTAYIRISPDFRNFKDRLEKQVQRNVENITARVDLDSESARAELRDLHDQNSTIKMSPEVDRRALQRAQGSLDKLSKKNRKVAFQADVDTIRAEQELKRFGKKQKINIDVGLDSRGFDREYTKIRRKLAKTNVWGDKAEKSAIRALERAARADEHTAHRVAAEQRITALQKKQQKAAERHEKDMASMRERHAKALAKQEDKTRKAWLKGSRDTDDLETKQSTRRKAMEDAQKEELDNLEKNTKRTIAARDKAARDKAAADAKVQAKDKELRRHNRTTQRHAAELEARHTAARQRLEERKVRKTEVPADLETLRAKQEAERKDLLARRGDRRGKLESELEQRRTERSRLGGELRGARSAVNKIRTEEQVRADHAEQRAAALRQETQETEDLNKAIRKNGSDAEKSLRELRRLHREQARESDERFAKETKQRLAEIPLLQKAVDKASRRAQRQAERARKAQLRAAERSAKAAPNLPRTVNVDRQRQKSDLSIRKFDPESGSALGRVNDAAARSGIDNSLILRDQKAIADAVRDARTYDAAQNRLHQTNINVARSEDTVRNAIAARNAHINQGTIDTEAGIKAMQRERVALAANTEAHRRQTIARAEESHQRDNFNASARQLDDRVNMHPLRRMGQTVTTQLSRGWDRVSDRIIFTGRMISAVSTLGMLAVGVLAGLGAVSLVPLIGSLGQVAGVLSILPAMAVGAAAAIAAIAVGMSGIGDAFKAGTKASDAAAKMGGAGDNGAQQRQIRDANQAAARTAEQGARQIASAEKSVAQAQKRSEQAQKDVTKAREAAREEIEEMNRALNGLAEDEEDAALSVDEARESLAEVLANPESTSTERRRADLSYRQAVRNLDELRLAHQKQREEAAEASAKGVEGADSVVSAQESAADAAEGVADAQQSLAQTQQDAAQANADAQQRIADAMEASASGSSAAATAALEYEEALKKLSPGARAFVVGMRSMSDEWTSLRKQVQENLFGGLATQITEVAKNQLPTLRAGLSDIASEINGGLSHALTYLSSEKSALDLSTIFSNSAEASGSFTRALSNLLRALIPLSAVGSDFLPRMAGSFENATRKFANFIEEGQQTGELLSFMTEMGMKTKEIGELFYQLGRVVGGVFKGGLAQGDAMIVSLTKWATGVGDFLNSAEGLKRSSEFFASAQTTLGGFLHLIRDIGEIIMTTIVPAFQTASNIVGPFVTFFLDGIVAFDKATGILGGLLTVLLGYKAITMIAALFAGLTRTVGMVGAAATGNVAKFTSLTTSHVRAGEAAAVHSGIIGRLTAALTAMGTAATIAGGKVAAAGGMAGVAAAGVGGLTRAAGGFMTAIGGFGALGLMAAVYGFMKISSAADKAKAKTAALAEAQSAYNASIESTNKSLRESRGEVDSGVLESLTAGTDAIMADAKARKSGRRSGTESWVKTFTDVFHNNPIGDRGMFSFVDNNKNDRPLNATQSDAINADADAGEAVLDLMNEMGLKSDDLALKLSLNDKEWWKFRNSLLAAGDAGVSLVGRLDPLRENFDRQQELILSLEPGYLDLADAITIMADKSAAAADKTDAFRTSLEALIPGNEEREAMASLSETIDQITQQLTNVDASKGIGADLIDDLGGVDTSTENGRNLNQMLMDLSTEAYRNAEAGNDMGEVWGMIDEKLAQAQVSFGLTDVQAKQLRETYRLFPSAISTQVGMTGADSVLQDLNAITEKFADSDFSAPVTKRIELKDMNSRAVLDQLDATTRVIDETKGIVEVTMDNEDVLLKFQDVQAYMSALNLMRANATMDLKTGTFTVNAQYAQQVISILAGMRPSPEVDLLMEKLKANQPIALADLQAITDKGAHPPIVLEQLGKFGEDVRNAQTALDGLSMGKKLTLAIQTQIEQEKNPPPPHQGPDLPFGVEVTPGKRPAGFHGGRIPMFAGGGRLPTTGPGTKKRDDIYAVGADGLARAMVNGGEWVINSAMSSKYSGLLGAINSDQLQGFAGGGILDGLLGGGLPAMGNPFEPIMSGLTMLGNQFQSILPGQAIPAFQQFGQQLSAATATFVNPALGGISAALGGLQTQFPLLASVVNPVWAAMSQQILGQKTAFIDPAFNGVSGSLAALQAQFPQAAGVINPTWSGMAQGIMDAKTGTIDPTFAGIQGGIGTVSSAFGMGVANIRTQWDGIRPATADPARFAVNDVFNNGIVGMWNSVSDILGTTRMNPYPIAFATGGPVYGPGGPTDDKIPAVLSNGEFVLNAAATKSAGVNNLKRFNDAHGKGGPAGMFGGNGALAFATGGLADTGSPSFQALKRAHAFAAKWSGTPYEWGGSFATHGGVDCSGYMSSIADVIQGGTGMMRKWATASFPGGGSVQGPTGPQGFVKGLGAGFSIGVSSPHTAGTLGGVEGLPTVNVESGGNVGGATYGGGAVGADHPQFPSRYHLPIVDGMFMSAGQGGGSVDLGSLVSSLTGPAWDKILRSANGYPGKGHIGQLPGKAALAFKASADKKINESVEAMTKFTGSIGGGGDVERWRPMVIAALKRNGFAATKSEQDIMLSQINSESSGNPKAIQQVQDVNTGGNEAVGLLQIAKGTWPGVRDPSLPDDRTDPWANMNAALRYYKATYGNDLSTNWGQGHGYDKGGLWENNTFGFNTSGGTEAVLTNPEWIKFQELVKALRDPQEFAKFIGLQPKQAPAVVPADDAGPAPTEPSATGDGTTPALPTAPSVGDEALEPGISSTTTPPTSGLVDGQAEQKSMFADYTGPLSQQLKQGELIGQLGQALSKPDAMMRLTNPNYTTEQSRVAKERQKALEDYRTQKASDVAKLRTEGKTAEADALEKGVDAKERELSEMPGTSPGTQARLATMSSETLTHEQMRKQAEDSFKKYLAENAMGIAESALSFGVGAVGNAGLGGGPALVVNGGVHTTDWRAEQRALNKRARRASRANSRVGKR